MGEGTKTTSKHLSQLLAQLMGQIGNNYQKRPDLVLLAWPQIIGEKLAPMTQAVSFNEGVLVVKVKNSTLYSLLARHEKERLLRAIKERFPTAGIRNLQFRIG